MPVAWHIVGALNMVLCSFLCIQPQLIFVCVQNRSAKRNPLPTAIIHLTSLIAIYGSDFF